MLEFSLMVLPAPSPYLYETVKSKSDFYLILSYLITNGSDHPADKCSCLLADTQPTLVDLVCILN